MIPMACCAPVRLRASRFVPLLEQHRHYNVEVAPGPTFVSGDRALPFHELLLADYQTQPGGTFDGRFGSGRAGFLGSAYLKGIGLTPLAANWNSRSDRYHGSGHMTASAAAREYVITKYLETRGLSECVVPCEGILAAPLDPMLADFGSFFELPCDRALQAITVKPGAFARWSNFHWLLDHMPIASEEPDRSVTPGSFIRSLAKALDPASPIDAAMTPAALVKRVRHAVDTTLQTFERFFEAGVNWSSVPANFTTDGRFLDLEVPILTGGPLLGVYEIRQAGHAPLIVALGFDWLIAAVDLHKNIKSLQYRIRRFQADAETSDSIDAYYSATDSELSALLDDPASPLSDMDEALRQFTAMVARHGDLTDAGRKTVERIGRLWGAFEAIDPPDVATFSTWLADIRTETTAHGDIRVLRGTFADEPMPAPHVVAFWEGLNAIDRATTVDEYFAAVRSAVSTF